MDGLFKLSDKVPEFIDPNLVLQAVRGEENDSLVKTLVKY